MMTSRIAFAFLTVLSVSVLLPASNVQAQNAKKLPPALVQIEDDPDLPRVLIIGDSISIGYTLPTRAMLDGVANVHRPPINCGPTTRGLEMIDDWLGEGEWDVIHFNFGLHDLKYMNKDGRLVDRSKGVQQVPIDDYAENLDELVKRLKKTGATLIWRNTTPVPEGSKGRVAGDAKRYNEAAAKVMNRHEVQIHDLWSYAKKHEREIQRPKNVHYTSEGSKRLAEQVADVIKGALEDE
jgi:acyl-CoA thioesterase-1